MIQVNRGVAPDGFESRASGWRQRFAEARIIQPKLTASKFWGTVRREIKPDGDELNRRFRGKCAFCESRMRHVSNPHIEHYRPKGQARFENLMFDWENWLLSCGRCNEEKWKDFPEIDGQPQLLDPVNGDPGEHVDFRGAEIIGLTVCGQETIHLIGLDRYPLRNERGQWLSQIDALLLLAVLATDSATKQEAREHLVWAMQIDAPYSAMTKAYLSIKCPKLARPAVPHPL
jgi:hypothetical protein